MIPTDETQSIDFDVQERVNYHIGQLLRDEDFRTEQQYLMARDDRHQRMLHGYGTVFGLEVFIEKPFEIIDEITVRPGVGVDRAGRTFVVHQPQCARDVEEWWNANNRPRAIYVVARYDEIETSPVLLAGQPCDDTVDGTVNSRLRDSMALELWDHKPQMPIFEVSRCMQQLLSRIVLDASADGSGQKALISSIEDICNSKNWQAQYPVTLKEFDEILDHWVTHVLPDLHAADHNNEDFPWVLLAELHLARTDTPKLTRGRAQDETPVRPLLLHTQLFQPPLRTSGGDSASVSTHTQKLVSVNATRDGQVLALDLWFHLDRQGPLQAITFAEIPQLRIFNESPDGGRAVPVEYDAPSRATRSNVYRYLIKGPDNANAVEPAYLRILIPAETSVTNADGNTISLIDYMRDEGIQFEGLQRADEGERQFFVTYILTELPVIGEEPIGLATTAGPAREVSADAPEAPTATRRRKSGKGRISS